MPAGRPSTYDPSFCEVIRDLMAQGYSKTAAAGSLGVSRQRLIDWAEANPEFRDAIKDGEAARTFKLEQDLLEAPDGPTVTSRIFALKNAAPHEWADTQKIVGPGPEGEHKHKIEADAGFQAIAGMLDSIQPGAKGGTDSAD